MAYIDSSVGNARVSDEPDADDGQGDELLEAPVERPRPRRRRRGSLKALLLRRAENINIAREIDQMTLDEIGAAVVAEYEIDLSSRDAWASTAEKSLSLANQDVKPKNYPWAGASNMIFPLISQAALDFQARTMPAIIQGKSVVKGIIWGDDKGVLATHDGSTDGPPVMVPGQLPGQAPSPVPISKPGEKRARADRIGEHMSWQLLVQMKEWKPELDKLLMQIPIIGGAVRKTFYEPTEKRNFSLFVSLLNLVWDYRASSFEAAPRHSEALSRYPHEILTNERTDIDDGGDGMWLALNYGPAEQGEGTSDVLEDQGIHDAADPDAPHIFIEQSRRWDLDGDGYDEPYVVTVHKRSCKVVRIVARYDEDSIVEAADGSIQRIEPVDYYTLIPFLPSMDGGSYPIGFGHLLRHINAGINTTLNQMFDAGHLANTGSGLISSDLTVPSGEMNFSVGKFIRVKGGVGKNIRDSVMVLPFPGPNTVLFQMLGLLINSGKEMASITDVMTGDANIANAPPTTVLALIEQGMALNNAIHTRVFWALGEEFQKLYRLNRKHLKEKTPYQIGDDWKEITPEDYRLSGGVEPVADPTMTTDMQRLARAALIKELCWGNPLFNQNEVATRVLEAGNVDRVADLFAPPDPNAPAMSQLMMAKAQAELGRERAAEQKDLTQAFLNMALAREKATAQEQAQIAAQMEFFRLRIEAVNAATRAAMADHAFHKTALDHHRGMTQLALDAAAPDTQTPVAASLTPGPKGPLPTNPGPQAIAAPPAPAPKPAPDNSTLPPLPPPGADPLQGAPGIGGPLPQAKGPGL